MVEGSDVMGGEWDEEGDEWRRAKEKMSGRRGGSGQ